MKMSYQNGHYSGTSASEYEDDEPTDEYVEVYSPPTEAVIILLDVDSFEVQVHGLDQGFSPEDLRTKPFVVVNEFGVITAVNYPAKKRGIKRSKDFNGNVIKTKYRDVNILEIPNHYEKPNSLIAKKASELIYESLRTSVSNLTRGRNLPIVEKASKDEFYVDVTDEVYYRVHKCGEQVPDRSTVFAMMDDCHNETPSYKATGKQFSFRALKVLTDPNIVQKRHETEALLVHGAAIAYQLLQDIMSDTDYICSAGVSSNKLLAKIGCGLHKPNSVTILPQASLPRVSKKIKIEDIPGLAGKLGESIKRRFKIHMMSALSYINRIDLNKLCGGENGIKFHQLAIGYDTTKVAEKYLSKSLKCGISFSYKSRRMHNILDFERHLRNRFLEMREHLAFECMTHGPARFPSTFRLEVKTRKRDMQSVFGATMAAEKYDLDHLSVPDCLLADRNFNRGTQLSIGWENMYRDFLCLLEVDCKISIFDRNPVKSEEAVRKVSAINLCANFDDDILLT